MHLSYSFLKYKGKKYKSYTIAESYRDGQKVKKRTIWPVGKLTDAQAQQMKLILKVAQGTNKTSNSRRPQTQALQTPLED
jgi:hypothetical protein